MYRNVTLAEKKVLRKFPEFNAKMERKGFCLRLFVFHDSSKKNLSRNYPENTTKKNDAICSKNFPVFIFKAKRYL